MDRKWKTIIVFTLLAAKLIFDFNGFWQLLSGTGQMIFSLLGYLLWGFLLAYILDGYAQFLEKTVWKRLNGKKTRRRVCIACAYFTLIGLVFLLVFSLIPALTDSFSSFTETIPGLIQKAINFYRSVVDGTRWGLPEKVSENVEDITHDVLDAIRQWISPSRVKGIVSTTTAVASNVLMGFFVSISMLLEKDSALNVFRFLRETLLPPAAAQKVKWISRQTNQVFRSYLTGKLLQAAAIMLLSYLVFALSGIPYSLLFAFLMGITNTVPYLGPWIGGLPVVLISLSGGLWKGLLAVLGIVLIQIIDSIFIQPRTVGKQIGISPLLVLTGLCLGGALFGLPGMMLGDVLIALGKALFYDPFAQKHVSQKKDAPGD